MTCTNLARLGDWQRRSGPPGANCILMNFCVFVVSDDLMLFLQNEPRREKTGLRGFRPGPTQTGLYSHRRWVEALNF